MDVILVGAGVLAFCAFMGHGDDEGWFSGTLKAVGLMVLVACVLLLAAYVFKDPNSSIWSQFHGDTR